MAALKGVAYVPFLKKMHNIISLFFPVHCNSEWRCQILQTLPDVAECLHSSPPPPSLSLAYQNSDYGNIFKSYPPPPPTLKQPIFSNFCFLDPVPGKSFPCLVANANHTTGSYPPNCFSFFRSCFSSMQATHFILLI